MADPESPSTETVTVLALRVSLRMARQEIIGYAQAFELRIDDWSERRRLLSTEITLTVTGTVDGIDTFRAAVGGGGLVAESSNPRRY